MKQNMKEQLLTKKPLSLMFQLSIPAVIGMVAIGMIGVIPILFLVFPTVLGIVAGPIIMLFMAKVQNLGQFSY